MERATSGGPVPFWETHTMITKTDDDVITQWIGAAKQGDSAAYVALIEQFTPCIRAAATRYSTAAVEREDLLQEGYVALIRAIQSFEPDRGVYFTWFAAGRIRQGVWTYTRRAKTGREREQFERSPQDDEDEPRDGLASLTDPMAEAAFAAVEAEGYLVGLTKRERLVVTHCIIGSMRTAELARMCDVSSATAYTWKRRAVAKLRRNYTAYTGGLLEFDATVLK